MPYESLDYDGDAIVDRSDARPMTKLMLTMAMLSAIILFAQLLDGLPAHVPWWAFLIPVLAPIAFVVVLCAAIVVLCGVVYAVGALWDRMTGARAYRLVGSRRSRRWTICPLNKIRGPVDLKSAAAVE